MRCFFVLRCFFATIAWCCAANVPAETVLRIVSHDSFKLSPALIAQFETEHHVKLRFMQSGDAGKMLNQLILSKKSPIADVVYGLDNALTNKAIAANLLSNHTLTGSQVTAILPYPVLSVMSGDVTLNVDLAWFKAKNLPLPKSLDELTLPAYKNLLVMENPYTSSVGYAFLMAVMNHKGDQAGWIWWEKMRHNGIKISDGWRNAYYQEFSRNGGTCPIVVSYASSPAAEVFFAQDKKAPPPTANLNLAGGVFHQVEGVALLKGGKHPELGQAFMAFLRSPAVQSELQTSMWMRPIIATAPVHPALKAYAQVPSLGEIAPQSEEKSKAWLTDWGELFLR
ncbi:MAG: thiamine ABC transporter substrate-binding protein [Neisseriaceae bacterium]|nr:thiamine ABC transporter substrate-binding protein [Neisseriaceae bacterium]